MESSIGCKVSDYEGFIQLLDAQYGDIYFKEPHYSQSHDRIDYVGFKCLCHCYNRNRTI